MSHATYRFQLLAPATAALAGHEYQRDLSAYEYYLGSSQKLRGRVYFSDGAILQSHLTEDGRYQMSDDHDCWHFLLVDETEQVIGCARYLLHPRTVCYEDLRISHSPLAADAAWASKLRKIASDTLQRTRQEGISYVELGGWAIADEYRNTKAALEILVGSYAWADLVGHCICSCTATVRNNSSGILRRMGAGSLELEGEVIPAYFDRAYGCTMELLGFDSRQLPPKFVPLLNQMRPKLKRSQIIQDSLPEENSVFSETLARVQAAISVHETLLVSASLSDQHLHSFH